MLKPILSRVSETVACYHQRIRTTDSITSIQPGAWQRYEAVLRVLAPLGLSFYMMATGIRMPGAPAGMAKAPVAETRVASDEPVYAAVVGRSKKSTKASKALAARRAQAARTSSRGAASMANINRLIVAAARRNGLDPALVRAVVRAESRFVNSTRSHVGAMGLMQLMPSTARNLGVTNPWDPAQNINGGTRFLAWLMREFRGNTRLAVAAYNAGPGAVKRYGGVPPYRETQRYVQKVLAFRANGG